MDRDGIKITLVAIVIVVLVVAVAFAGNKGTRAIKNIQSNYANLDRDVLVINSFTGDTLFKYSGPCYFDTERGGAVSLIYERNGKQFKADWAGTGFVFFANEK